MLLHDVLLSGHTCGHRAISCGGGSGGRALGHFKQGAARLTPENEKRFPTDRARVCVSLFGEGLFASINTKRKQRAEEVSENGSLSTAREHSNRRNNVTNGPPYDLLARARFQQRRLCWSPYQRTAVCPVQLRKSGSKNQRRC